MCFTIKFIYKINRDLIFSYLIENNIDISEFCEKCHITIKEFSDIMKNDPYIDPIMFAKISKILNIKLIDLLI